MIATGPQQLLELAYKLKLNFCGRFGGVHAKLAMLVIGCVLPISLVAGALLFVHYGNARAAVRDANITRVRAMASALDREFAKTEAGLLALSTAPALVAHDSPRFRAQALAALDNIDADSIVLLAPGGQMILNTRMPTEAKLPKLDRTPLLIRILQSGRPEVSELFEGPLRGIPIIAVGVPVTIDGKIAYTLNAILEPRRLNSILSEQKFPDSWRAAITDASGRLAARSHEISKFIGKKVNEELVEKLQENEGAFEPLTLDSIPVVTVYSRSPISRWAVMVGIPVSELDAGIHGGLAWLAAAVFGALTTGLTLAWFIGGKIAGSIRNLVEPARALGLGLSVNVSNPYFLEADEVGCALLEAAAQLERAKFEAMHDPLTGLSNRNAFNLTVKHQLALSTRNQTTLAVLYIDLDGFKTVNDTRGHACGDALLRAVGERLQSAIRSSDLAARLGGDEFAILLVQAEMEGAMAFAARLIKVVSAPYLAADINLSVSASIGIACGPNMNEDADTLIKHADKAMYMAKAQGKSRACIAPSSCIVSIPGQQALADADFE